MNPPRIQGDRRCSFPSVGNLNLRETCRGSGAPIAALRNDKPRGKGPGEGNDAPIDAINVQTELAQAGWGRAPLRWSSSFTDCGKTFCSLF